MWRTLDNIPLLQPNDCHVWLFNTLDYFDMVSKIFYVLNERERKHAGTFRFECDATQYIVSRYLLRLLLAEQLDCTPDELCFSYNDYGKPGLLLPEARVQFNLSHSHQYLIIAYTLDVSVGVDIEKKIAHQDLDQMAQLIFSDNDLIKYNLLDPNERTSAFYRAWSHKEAFVKCLGLGFSYDVKQCEIAFTTDKAFQYYDKHYLSRLINLAPCYELAIALADEGKNIQTMHPVRGSLFGKTSY